MAPAGGVWIVARRTTMRAVWGGIAVALVAAVTVAAAVAFAAAPHVDTAVMLVLAVVFLLLACVLAFEGVSRGMVRVDAAGYGTPLGSRRAWADVLAIGTGEHEGQQTPVVAVRSPEGFGVDQDVFAGFSGEDAPRLVAALRQRAGEVAGFRGVHVAEGWWAQAEAEADRAVFVVRETTGREPLTRQRVEFGFPGLASAIAMDYGTNDQGEGISLIAREGLDLALEAHGRRWFRQNRKRSADPATQVGVLFGPHTSEVVPSGGMGFDRLVVSAAGHRLTFNAEEPNRFGDAF